jgi:hypothetical protein
VGPSPPEADGFSVLAGPVPIQFSLGLSAAAPSSSTLLGGGPIPPLRSKILKTMIGKMGNFFPNRLEMGTYPPKSTPSFPNIAFLAKNFEFRTLKIEF